MKKLITLVLLVSVTTGCSTVQSGLEKIPTYEDTPTDVKVKQAYEALRTQQLMQ